MKEELISAVMFAGQWHACVVGSFKDYGAEAQATNARHVATFAPTSNPLRTIMVYDHEIQALLFEEPEDASKGTD